jgi:hypothetical protein
MIRSEAASLIGLTEIPDPGAICFSCRAFSSSMTLAAASLPASYSIPA